jgi:Phage T7 tail fibre protein
MPLSFNESTATGVTTPGSSLGTDFPIYFPYLAKAHINVDFNKVLQSQNNFVVYDANEAVVPAGAFGTSTAFVRFTTGYPTAGAVVRVRRTTEKAFPLVDFQDGSALTADDQDLAFLQNFYLNQESVEQADNALGKVGLVYYANGIRITEVGQPTQNNDATTKLYVDTQDALKVAKAGDTMSGALAMGTNKITGLGTPTLSTDASTKGYVDTNDALKVTKAGDSMTGSLDMGNNKITGLGTPTANNDATTKNYVDTADASLTSSKVSKSGDSMSGALAMGNNKITGLGTPTASTDASTKAYADTKLSLSGGVMTGVVDFGGLQITDIADPVLLNDGATKQYVDSSIQQYITTGGVSGNPTRWQFTGNGSTLVFNITGATAIYTNSYLVTIDGVVQDPTYSYNVSISGATQTLTFDQAPPSGTRVVVIALGYALPTISAIPNNTVSTNSIVDDAVTSAKLRDDASVDANRAVTTNHIRDLAVTTAKLADDSVTADKLRDDAATDANRAVTTNHIRDLAVSTGKIANNAVTDTKLSSDASVDANRAVNTNHIKDNAVTTAKILNNAVTNAKLSSSATIDADRAVGTDSIKDNAVTNAKLGGGITAAKLVNSGVTAGTYGSTTQSPQIVVNAQGLVTSASNQTITIPPQKLVNYWSSIKTDTFSSGNGWRYVSITGLQIGTTPTAPYTGGNIVLASASNRVRLTGVLNLGENQNYLAGVRLARYQTGLAPIAATAMVAGSYYMIVTLGTTAFTSFGSQANAVGCYFRATGAGTGTGTVILVTMVGNGTINGTKTAVLAGRTINSNQWVMVPAVFDVIDTPGFTNVTYDLLLGNYTTGVSYLNRSSGFQDGGGSGSGPNAYDLCPSSTFNAEELTP